MDTMESPPLLIEVGLEPSFVRNESERIRIKIRTETENRKRNRMESLEPYIIHLPLW